MDSLVDSAYPVVVRGGEEGGGGEGGGAGKGEGEACVTPRCHSISLSHPTPPIPTVQNSFGFLTKLPPLIALSLQDAYSKLIEGFELRVLTGRPQVNPMRSWPHAPMPLLHQPALAFCAIALRNTVEGSLTR